MIIKTEYRTDPSGRGKMTAKSGGKQRTITYDHSRSIHQNHGDAAGALLLKSGDTSVHILAGANWQHEILDNGKQRFTLND